jgi:hypothetical protein
MTPRTTAPPLVRMYSPAAGSGLGTGRPLASRYMAHVRPGGKGDVGQAGARREGCIEGLSQAGALGQAGARREGRMKVLGQAGARKEGRMEVLGQAGARKEGRMEVGGGAYGSRYRVLPLKHQMLAARTC